ncbi:hypothetical protein [Amycolatopsis minnesotensis]|uniref:Uncharacterized protein n=1 Tax=Amycolatopsis minnesotensis TaxID=337894 RepID=A0ABP5BZY7_9PSEU
MSVSPSPSCSDALAGAGAPTAFREALRARTAETDAVDAGLRRVCAPDSGPPELLSGPLLGRALAELTGRGPDESEMDPRGIRPSEPAARPVLPEPLGKPARPPRPVAARSGCRPRAEHAPALPVKPIAVVVPDAAPERTDPCKVSAERLRGLAGPPPAPACPRIRRTAPTAGPAVVRRTEPPVSSTADAASELPSSLARGAAKRVRADCGPALIATFGGALRPGPIAPAALLERLAPDRSGHPRRAPVDRKEESRRPVARPTGAGPVAPQAPAAEPVPDRPHPVAPPSAELETRTPEESEVDKVPTRLSAQFAELPEIPRRERVSAPGRSNPNDVAKPSPPPENTVSEADLELMMRRILDNAARRHGIEV